MPARNSAHVMQATLGQGFDCPMGDGGHCALPSPPILVERGEMRQVLDAANELGSRTVASQRLRLMRATGVDGMRELVEESAQDRSGGAPAVVLPCSCGHVFAASDRGEP